MEISFGDISFLYYLIVIPIGILLFFLSFSSRKIKLRKFFDKDVFENLTPSFSLIRKMTSFSFALLSLIFIILALARPQTPAQNIIEKSEGIEIIILADVSRSMLVQDVYPNRLTLLKNQLNRFVSLSKKNHRMGLIAFAGSSFLLSPLTSDLNLIRLYLDSLSTDMISSQGTNMKIALKQALDSFEGGAISSSTKVLIIASDGEDNEVGALEQIRNISRKGIRIFSLGFGTEQGGAVVLGNNQYQKDYDGNVVYSKFKGNLLKEYAKIGKGAFYHIKTGSDFAKKLHQDFIDLDQHVFEERKKLAQHERFQYFILLAIFFAVAHLIFSERRLKR